MKKGSNPRATAATVVSRADVEEACICKRKPGGPPEFAHDFPMRRANGDSKYIPENEAHKA
jgi:hypothetical protein